MPQTVRQSARKEAAPSDVPWFTKKGKKQERKLLQGVILRADWLKMFTAR